MATPSSAIVWDFDHSLINDNSDTYVPRLLCPPAARHIAAHARTVPWTQLMDDTARVMHEHGVTAADVRAALRGVPVLEHVPRAVRAAAAAGARQVIVSDANTVYIEDALEALADVRDALEAIVTNPAHYDGDGRLRIAPRHAATAPPHGCPLCPANLCKGAEVRALGLAAAAGGGGRLTALRVLYVGDGGGDVCGCLQLGAGDVVAARSGTGFGLLPALLSGAHRVAATVRPWADGAELGAIVAEFLAGTGAGGDGRGIG